MTHEQTEFCYNVMITIYLRNRPCEQMIVLAVKTDGFLFSFKNFQSGVTEIRNTLLAKRWNYLFCTTTVCTKCLLSLKPHCTQKSFIVGKHDRVKYLYVYRQRWRQKQWKFSLDNSSFGSPKSLRLSPSLFLFGNDRDDDDYCK